MSKDWFVWEKIRRIYPFQNLDFLTYISVLPAPAIHVPSGVKYENKNVELLAKEKDFFEAGKKIATAVIENPEWFNDSLEKIDEKASAYIAEATKLTETRLDNKTNAQLKEIFNKVYDKYLESHYEGLNALVAEVGDELISNNLRAVLAKKISEKKIKISPEKAFAVLSQTKNESSLSMERKALAELTEKLSENKALAKLFEEKTIQQIESVLSEQFPEFDSLLNKHWKKFEWIFFMYEGPTLQKSYFIKELKESQFSLAELKKEFALNDRYFALQQKLVKRLSDSENEKLIFSFPRKLIETKASRKDAMYFGCYAMEKLFLELAKRFSISLDEVRFLQRQELFDVLSGKRFDFSVLKQRIEYSVFFAVEGKTSFLVGEEAKKWYSENVRAVEATSAKIIKGTPAFQGRVKGTVRIINHPNEMPNMVKGDILVSHTTNPNLLPAMTKAAAIITDIGGLTCHAAIVAREFRIPCIVGTKIATQLLKDGDMVDVDAENGIVTILGK